MLSAYRIALTVLLALYLAAPATSAPSAENTSATPPSSELRIGPRRVRGPLASTFVMPGARLRLRAHDAAPHTQWSLNTHGHGVLETARPTAWRWRAPSTPGLYTLTLGTGRRSKAIRLNVFVKTPFDNAHDTLDGYRIGRYAPNARPGDARSAPPTGLVAVTAARRDTPLSPHFTLDQFLCHQQPGHWPKYVLVRPRLLDKLERLTTALADIGIPADALTIMSGFRTPWYNADIGNTTVYSQHLYGSGADVFVDSDASGRMDDLNASGRVDIGDAQWLADRVAAITAAAPTLQGGLSAYPGNARHGPFVHLDVRGVPARW